MLSHTLHLILLLLLGTAAAASQQRASYTSTDFILLNCGATSSSNDTSNRSWDTDTRSRYTPSNAATISSTPQPSSQHSSVNPVPYMTARVFTSQFTYSFPVLSGPKFLRLYFYPTTYANFSPSQSYFRVTANGFTLLSNFSASLNSPSLNETAFMKEFIVYVGVDQKLNLTFSPMSSNSFAFVNGIEIVSMPDELYFRGDVAIPSVDQVYYLKNDTALECVYRLNVGGSDIKIQDDSGPVRGMFRAWSQDEDYVYNPNLDYSPNLRDVQEIKYGAGTPAYTAPQVVYASARVIANYSRSLEWGFRVNTGFNYLLRFHFCEFTVDVTEQNQRVFAISVNNRTLENLADVIFWAKEPKVAVFRDYIVLVPNDGRRGKRDMLLTLYPSKEGNPKYNSAILNGLEIFKLSDSDRSLAGANPNPDHVEDSSSSSGGLAVSPRENSKRNRSRVIYGVVGGVTGALLVGLALSFLIFRQRRRVKDSVTVMGTTSSWVPLSVASRSTNSRTSGSGKSLPSNLSRHFWLEEIKTATGDFDDNFVIGRGGFGNVYKGYIDDGATAVAIKRLHPDSNQGAREFLTEIEMLSRLRHVHLVSLIGYCDENGEMILVYDYMEHGTLRDHLYHSLNHPLTWQKRLQICIGAAKGLHYLHTGAKFAIIHRDVKSTNILLDEKWVAKVSDFGLSRVGPTGGVQTHVSTVVKGSFGYVDPEYYKRQQLTDKSDVYSFGVVLLEVLCARPPIISTLPREQVNLGEWAKVCCKKGTIEQIVDSNIQGQIAPECLTKFVETAALCLRDKGKERPTMSDVVWNLEFAMQLQEAADINRRTGDVAGDGGGSIAGSSPSFPLLGHGGTNTTDDEEVFSGSSDAVHRSKSSGLSTSSSDKLKSGDVFSALMNPEAR